MAKKGGHQEVKGPATISNRKAGHEYELLERWEAGLVLVGSEVKSLYLGRASMVDAYVRISAGEAWLYSFDIEPYVFSTTWKPERRRDRKLLLNKSELRLIQRKTEEKGLALVPTKVYFKGRKAKVEIALARGKKTYDKRESLKEKDQARARARGIEE
jgi:SsrA-binding protein